MIIKTCKLIGGCTICLNFLYQEMFHYDDNKQFHLSEESKVQYFIQSQGQIMASFTSAMPTFRPL